MQLVEYVASRHPVHVRAVEDTFTQRQIELLYYLGHKDEYAKIRAQATLTGKIFASFFIKPN